MDPAIEVYIDEIILHGFSPHQRYDIAGAIETELKRLFTEQGMPAPLQKGGRTHTLNAGSFTMQQESKGETLGNNIAGSVYKSFGK